MFAPLRTLGVPEPVIDVVEPFFREVVELGYDRSITPWEPTPARLIPMHDPATVAADLVNAIGEGINNALALSGLPPLLSIPAAPATDTGQPTSNQQTVNTGQPTANQQTVGTSQATSGKQTVNTGQPTANQADRQHRPADGESADRRHRPAARRHRPADGESADRRHRPAARRHRPADGE